MRVAVVNVGDELLAGDTVNTNAAWLADELDDSGVDVERVLVVPDDVDVIADAVRRYSDHFDAVIVTGGLGPTHDDLTMEAVAEAFGVAFVENEEAREMLLEEYNNEDLVEETAYLPEGSTPLRNQKGVAPGCVINNVYVLPGVPREMKAMYSEVEDDFEGGERHSVFLVTSDPESSLIPLFKEVREEFDVLVGSYPGEGRVRVKFTAGSEGEAGAAREWLAERVEVIEED